MSSRDFDRRNPRVTVQDLRRDLRHADEQLFTLLDPIRPTPARVRPRRGPLALALIGILPLGFGAWAAFADVAGDRPANARPVQVEVTPVVAAVVPNPAHAEPTIVDYHPPAATPRLRPAPRAAAAMRGATITHAGTAPTAAQNVSWQGPRRHVPRPLSPGEFGRR